MSTPSIVMRPLRDVLQPRHERGQRGLAGAGGPDDRDGLAGLDLEPEVGEGVGVGVGEPERDALELQPAVRLTQLLGAADDGGLRVEDLHHPLGPGHRLLRHREDLPGRLDRPDQLEHQRHERDQRTQGDVPAAGGDRTGQHHDDERHVRDEPEQGPEARGHPHLLERGLPHLAGALVVTLEEVVTTAEGLGGADADGTFLDQGGQVALLVLDLAGHLDVAVVEVPRGPDDRQVRQQHDDAQRPVHVQQEDRHDGDLDDIGHQEDDSEAQEPPDDRQVGGGARQQLPALPPAVEAHRQQLQVRVQVVTDLGLEAEDGLALRPPAHEHQERLDDAEDQREQAERPEAGLVVVRDRAVDDLLGHQRHGDARERAEDRRTEHDGQLLAVRVQVAPHAQQRGHTPERASTLGGRCHDVGAVVGDRFGADLDEHGATADEGSALVLGGRRTAWGMADGGRSPGGGLAGRGRVVH